MCNKKGFGMIETVVGLAIMIVVLFAVLQSYNYYLRFAFSHRYDVKAALLAEEGVEAVKFLRDSSWSKNIGGLQTGTLYSLVFDGQSWATTTTSLYIDGIFDRTFKVDSVYRNSDDDISTSGVLDPGTVRLTVNVSYNSNFGTTTKSISTYITNLFDN